MSQSKLINEWKAHDKKFSFFGFRNDRWNSSFLFSKHFHRDTITIENAKKVGQTSGRTFVKQRLDSIESKHTKITFLCLYFKVMLPIGNQIITNRNQK